MARPINQIQQFRNRINAVLSAIEQAQAAYVLLIGAAAKLNSTPIDDFVNRIG